ncbi:TraB/GumN family protein [sulfur-oxidizing endosymbiont of Gigantopelta aegis]|uniref:TraB/GumN family protein n=1 Tax=sulfur-oxidizing endosymbiont of Gigantopelta aegis TaxID=2794934 RepID=UPI0018DB67B7
MEKQAAPETDNSQDEPLFRHQLAGKSITVLGTAHVSKTSAEKVQELLETGEYDGVAIELCPSRYNSMIDPDSLAKMDLFQVFKEGKASMVIASLALGAYQQKMADEFGIEPGAEMRMAIDQAKKMSCEVHLIDREVGTTLKRVYNNVPWWKRMGIVGGLLGSVVSNEKVSEDEIERLKDGDMLETTFAQFAEEAKELFEPLIDERDQYMAARLEQIVSRSENKSILAVVGAGHLKGIESYLAKDEQITTPEALHQKAQTTIDRLDELPKKSRWPKVVPWVIVAILIAGFAYGFSKSTELGMQLIVYWVLINGSLSALGAALAKGHPLTVVGAFIAAPLTSLNPTIGAGMVTAAIELYLRKPNVGDFSALRKDTTHISGWWKNKVARTLLVFFFSTIGSAIGTYVAGFKIFNSLVG